MVTAWPMALCGLSGATITTSPRCFTASTKLRIPGAVMPSSLLIKISGLFWVIEAKLTNTPTLTSFAQYLDLKYAKI